MENSYEEAAAILQQRLPQGNLAVIIGSASFRDPLSPDICVSVGRELALMESLPLITGGVPAVG